MVSILNPRGFYVQDAVFSCRNPFSRKAVVRSSGGIGLIGPPYNVQHHPILLEELLAVIRSMFESVPLEPSCRQYRCDNLVRAFWCGHIGYSWIGWHMPG
jgi:hypothetical protein